MPPFLAQPHPATRRPCTSPAPLASTRRPPARTVQSARRRPAAAVDRPSIANAKPVRITDAHRDRPVRKACPDIRVETLTMGWMVCRESTRKTPRPRRVTAMRASTVRPDRRVRPGRTDGPAHVVWSARKVDPACRVTTDSRVNPVNLDRMDHLVRIRVGSGGVGKRC